MTNSQKLQNEMFFTMVISRISEGGYYIYPDANETYTMKGGKLVGTQRGIRILQEITTPAFHINLIVNP